MQTIKCLIIALILTVRIYKAEVVVPTSSSDESTSYLIEAVVKIITSCYGDQINTVGLAGNLPDTIGRILSVQHLIPITLMDDASHMTHSTTLKFVPDGFRYKLPVFIVGASSTDELITVIRFSIISSIWWNHMASFIILDQSRGCVNINYFLYIAWQLDLLNAKVLCYHHAYGTFIFNYNPFTSQAPAPWQPSAVFGGKNDHPFTTLIQKYQGNETICTNLDFVKTKNLAGYEFLVEGNAQFHKFRQKERPGLSRLVADRERTLYMIFRTLNVTPKFTGLNRQGGLDVDMIAQTSVLLDTVNGITYPHQQFGVVLITKFRGHKSQLQKILDIIDVNSRIGLGIVYFVTLAFFVFVVKQAVGPALLNLIRITCNTGFTNLPSTTAARMYLTGLLFFVVTMQGIYQGNLASLLTSKIPVRNVNTFKELKDFGYKVYGMGGMRVILAGANLDQRFVGTENVRDCITNMLNDSLAACMTFAVGDIFDDVRQYDLHVSKDFLAVISGGFQIRPFFYLEEQLNTILGTMAEADIFETWESKCNPIKLTDYEYDAEVRNNADFKVIEFVELRFAFVILGIGLLGATVTFIVEVVIY